MSKYESPYKNKNVIYVNEFSNPEALKIYKSSFEIRPDIKKIVDQGRDCCLCKYYLAFDQNWGLCSNRRSEFYLNTIFEHFSCVNHGLINRGKE